MAKLGSISVDNRILDAARDGTLVVFAGAGVSMGPPSHLPDFKALAAYIADGTGSPVEEPFDRFLGQLHLRGVPVHKRAAVLLSVTDSRPKELHKDLLRIFASVDRVRIVTTNFDPHFGSASYEVFGQVPQLYCAPALPRGNDFIGIVHVHGALTDPDGLVLTDADFGRAYLTEGWARRFLVDVFRRYTVLFVGYSHGDVVMNYLARALPADSVAGRFALTETDGNWKALGITPIRFSLTKGANAFTELEDGMRKLADLVSRGILEWQLRLSELAAGAPPVDDEAVDEVEQALREVHTTRFLLRATRDPRWLHWLGKRGHLDALFRPGALSDRDNTMLMWLAENFVHDAPDQVFDLVARKGARMNADLWGAIAARIGLEQTSRAAPRTLERWVTILLATQPVDARRANLIWLARKCGDAGADALLLRIFLYLCEHDLNFSPNNQVGDAEDGAQPRRMDADCTLGCDVHQLSELWTDHVKPTLPTNAYPLLTAVTRSLEQIHRDLATWDMVSHDWDPHSYHRSAIEEHEPDRFPQPIDVLVDATRDALEHLAEAEPLLVDAWLTSVNLAVPLLRRIAIHATTKQPGRSPDGRLHWILRHVGLAGDFEHHEVYRAVALSYPTACDDTRKSVVDAVLAIEEPAAGDWSAEKMTDWAHFAWLSWLLRALPDCPYARSPLAPIKQRYPEWEPDAHPDFTHDGGMTTIVRSESPWPAEQLLATPAPDQLAQLLNFEGTQFFSPGRTGLLAAVTTACKQQPTWAFDLMAALHTYGAYSSDLWGAALRGLREGELTADQWRDLLAFIGQADALSLPVAQISELLYALVRDGGKPFALDLLDSANDVAFRTWQAIGANETDQDVRDWLSAAINRPAGIIVEFWLSGLSVLMRGKAGHERHLPDAYKRWFEIAISTPGPKGGYCRAVLASQVAYLFGLGETWTREHVIPLFVDPDPSGFAQAWDGFLAWGKLNQALAADMLPAFAEALARIEQTAQRRNRFIQFYSALAVYYADEPAQQLLPDLLRTGSVEDRVAFAVQIGSFLRAMDNAAKRTLWQRWLRWYWTMRLEAAGAPLDDQENTKMIDWLAHMGDCFADAVDLAVQAPRVTADHSGLLFALRENDLPMRFPEPTARLLIYLCDCVRGYMVDDLARIAGRLPPLPPEIDRRLKEQLARAGA